MDKTKLAALGLGLTAIGAPAAAHAQVEPLLGQVAEMAFTFCPRGWMPAEGQLMSIARNTALFSLLGTTYGGDGRTTFALPDLRPRGADGKPRPYTGTTRKCIAIQGVFPSRN